MDTLPKKSVDNSLEEFTILIQLDCFLMLSDTEKMKEWSFTKEAISAMDCHLN